MTAARRGKPLTGTMMLRPALRLPAPTSDANRVEYELANGLLIMRVKDARDKAGVMYLDVQGRFEDEVYEMCLLFRGAAARYMERCPAGGTTDTLVLQDLINNPRCGEDFPIARGGLRPGGGQRRPGDQPPKANQDGVQAILLGPPAPAQRRMGRGT